MFELEGRTALITGSGQGMGSGIAKCLAAAGARVYINDVSEKRAERVAAALRDEDLDAKASVFDVTDIEAFKAAVEDIGIIDILVNNAGIVRVSDNKEHFASFADSKPANWQKQFDLNVFGVMNGAHAVLPGMRAQKWGRIITISSDSGRKGTTGLSIYSASKAAGLQFTRCIAVEEGRHGITANSVSLGLMENAVKAGVSEDISAYFGELLAQTPVSRPGTSTDVGSAVTFLATQEAEWITGQNLAVNGGFDTF